jgi:hypothetical protein
MGRNSHPDYLYFVKKDLTWEKISEHTSPIIDNNFLCFVKTVFVKINGDYTYSNHYILDKNMNEVFLKYGSIEAGKDIFTARSTFYEYLATFHQASIRVQILDTTGVERDFRFSHNNGLGSWYSDIDGQGILSIIDALKIMKELDELKSWEIFDIVFNVKKRIAFNLLRGGVNSVVGFKEIVELSDYYAGQIWDDYIKNR